MIRNLRFPNQNEHSKSPEPSQPLLMNYQIILTAAMCIAVPMVAFFTYIAHVKQLTSRNRIRSQEREWLARDLHDTILQGVQSLLWCLETAIRRPMDESTRKMLVDAAKLARGAVIEGRDKVQSLRTEVRSDIADHEAMLVELAEALACGHPACFESKVDGAERSFKGDSGEDLMSVLREALTNAFIHAKAAKIELSLSYKKYRFVASVADDGIGIDREILDSGSRHGHWGLLGMSERVRLLAGQLTIDSIKGQGTKVTVRIPARGLYHQF